VANRKVKKAAEIAAPPAEQMREGAFTVQDIMDKRRGGGIIAIGKAYRRKPMIDVLAGQGVFTPEEHKALRHYRHHADIADRSPTRDSLCLQRGGNGDGPTITTLNAVRLVADVEAAAGSLANILRAIVVDDLSLSQWAITRHGGLDKSRLRKGKEQRTVEPRDEAVKIARMEIRIAAQRVQAELDA
jgi:hypothetical protein